MDNMLSPSEKVNLQLAFDQKTSNNGSDEDINNNTPHSTLLVLSLRERIKQLETENTTLKKKLLTFQSATTSLTSCSSSTTTAAAITAALLPRAAALQILSTSGSLDDINHCNSAAKKILNLSFQHSKDMTQVLNVLVEHAIDGASTHHMGDRNHDRGPIPAKVQAIVRVLSILGKPPSSLALQRRFLQISKRQNGFYWRDGKESEIFGPFLSRAEALHDACLESDPAERILLRCLKELQHHQSWGSCLSTMRVLALLHKEGVTPSEVMVQMVKRILQESRPLKPNAAAVLAEIMNALLMTSPHVVTPSLGKQVERVLIYQ